MNSRRRLLTLFVVFLMVSLFLVACERPLQDEGAATITPAPDSGEVDTDQTDSPAPDESGDETAAGEGEDADASDADASDADASDATGEDADTADSDAGDAPGGDADTADSDAGDADTSDADTSDADSSDADSSDATEGDADAPADSEAGDDTEGAVEETDEAAAGDGSDSGEVASEGELPGTPHTVAEGETLFDIAAQYDVSWVVIADYNSIEDVSTLEVGTTVFIPPQEGDDAAAEGDTDAAAEGDTDAAAEGDADAATASDATAPATTEGDTATAAPATGTTYTVNAGDNLFRIGLQYGMSWVQIAEANGIVNPNRIYPGQELIIPVGGPAPSPETTHLVMPGETLLKIAQQYGLSWQTIAQANQIGPPFIIYAGQTLVIPSNGS